MDTIRDIVFFSIVIIIAVFAAWAIGVSHAYRVGQIDALSGKVYYHLVTHPDSTKTWEHIEKGEKSK